MSKTPSLSSTYLDGTMWSEPTSINTKIRNGINAKPCLITFMQ